MPALSKEGLAFIMLTKDGCDSYDELIFQTMGTILADEALQCWHAGQ